MMMRYCEGKASEGGFKGLEMGATLSGVALYERCGYTRSGKIDVVRYVSNEDGGDTHVLMIISCPNGEGIRIVHMLKDPAGFGTKAEKLDRNEPRTNEDEKNEV